MNLSRRALLGAGAAVAALGAIGFTVADLPAPAPGFLVLSEGEAATIRALYDVLFPPGNAFGVAGRDVDLAPRIDLAFADELDPDLVPAFRLLLRAIDLGALPVYGSRFADLAEDARRTYFASWEDPANLPLRMGFEVLKVPLSMAWFYQPDVLHRIGWRASCAAGGTV